MADIIYEDYYGAVIRVEGACYNFWKEVPDDLTQDPSPDALFDTCEECSSSSLSEEASSFSPEESSASEAPEPYPILDCSDCGDPDGGFYRTTELRDFHHVRFRGLTGDFGPYTGDHVLYRTDAPLCLFTGGPGNNVSLYYAGSRFTGTLEVGGQAAVWWLKITIPGAFKVWRASELKCKPAQGRTG